MTLIKSAYFSTWHHTKFQFLQYTVHQYFHFSNSPSYLGNINLDKGEGSIQQYVTTFFENPSADSKVVDNNGTKSCKEGTTNLAFLIQ
jgi:hypothetical protein